MPDGSVQGIPLNDAYRDQDPQSHGQIIGRTLFAHIGWCQVDYDRFAGEFDRDVFNRGPDSFAAFLHRCIRKSNNDDVGQAGAEINFYFY